MQSNLRNLQECHGWEIEYNRVLKVWHVLSEGNMPMEHTLAHRVRELLKDKPNGVSVPLMCEKLSCEPKHLVHTRNFLNREDPVYRMRKDRASNSYILEKKDECI